MINAELLEKLNAMSAEVTKLETEAKRTVDNVNEQIAKSRAEKEHKIVEFLHSLEETFKVGGFPRCEEHYYLCCGTHWEGKPGACGSHGRSIGVTFQLCNDGRVSVYFGRYFLGSDNVDYILYVGEKKLEKSYTLSSYGSNLANGLRENIIDRWTDETEKNLADWMVNIVKENLQKRISTATQTLKDANDKHDEYFKEV